MHFTLYKITNLINNKIYIGIHQTQNLDDGYMGSGKNIRAAINKYGIENFKKEILEIFDEAEAMYEAERNVVNQKFVSDKNTYNIAIGGGHGWEHMKNYVVVRDIDGNTFTTSKDDPLYLSGKVVPLAKGYVCAKDNDGNMFKVSIDDPRYKCGELIHNCSGKIMMKDTDGNCKWFNKSEMQSIPKDFVPIFKNKVVVQDIDGNILHIDIDDPRYLSGELFSINKNKVSVRDKIGNTFKVDIDDPRYKSGELIHVSCGYKYTKAQRETCSKNSRGKNNPNFGKCWISNTKTQEVKSIFPEHIDTFLDAGWVKGKIRFNKEAKRHIHNPITKKNKCINISQLSEYLNSGWVFGRYSKKQRN